MIHLKKIFCIFLMTGLPLYAADPIRADKDTYKWGNTYEEFTKGLPKNLQSETFRLSGRPDYNNMILNYVIGLNSGLTGKTVIFRIMMEPVKEYVFINNRLSCISYLWENAQNGKEKDILAGLGREFGSPEIKTMKKETLYTYNNNITKVMMYKTPGEDGSIKYRLYFYPRNLFRLLIME